MNKIKLLKTPCKKITEYERNNSDLINTKQYKSLLGALLYISVKVKT